MSLGELQAAILGAIQKLGKASAREIMGEIGAQRKVAYTTVSTVLDRLHKKGLVKRSKVIGGGEPSTFTHMLRLQRCGLTWFREH